MQAWGDDGKSLRPLEWQCFNLLLYTAVHRGFFMDRTPVLNSVSAQTTCGDVKQTSQARHHENRSCHWPGQSSNLRQRYSVFGVNAFPQAIEKGPFTHCRLTARPVFKKEGTRKNKYKEKSLHQACRNAIVVSALWRLKWEDHKL